MIISDLDITIGELVERGLLNLDLINDLSINDLLNLIDDLNS